MMSVEKPISDIKTEVQRKKAIEKQDLKNQHFYPNYEQGTIDKNGYVKDKCTIDIFSKQFSEQPLMKGEHYIYSNTQENEGQNALLNQLTMHLDEKDKQTEIVQKLVNIASNILKAIQKDFNNYDIINLELKYKPNKPPIMQIVYQMDVFLNAYTWINTLTVNLKTNTISSKTIFMYLNGVDRVVITSKQLRLLISRYFLKLNSSLRFGAFCINLAGGEILMKMNCPWNQKLLDQTIGSKYNFESFLKTILYTQHYALQFHTFKLLADLNFLSAAKLDKVKDFVDDGTQSIGRYKPLQEDCTRKLMKVGRFLEKSDRSITLQYPDEWEMIKKDYFQRPSQSSQQSQQSQQSSKVMQSGTGNTITTPTNISNQPVLSQYDIKKINQVENQKNVFILEYEGENNEKKEIKVVQVQESPERIKYAKKILGKFKDQGLYNICKFVSNKNDDQTLYYEQEQNLQQLEEVQKKLKNTLSLNSYLYFLSQISFAIYYMKENGIINNDIKENSVYVTQEYVTKINNFCDAYHKEISEQSFMPEICQGNTSPEILNKQLSIQQKFNEKTDVFMFGCLISRIIFQTDMYVLKPNNLQKIQQQYEQNTYKIKPNNMFHKQLGTHNGPKHLMNLLYMLVLQCIEEQKNRCNVECMCIVLKEAQEYVESHYGYK